MNDLKVVNPTTEKIRDIVDAVEVKSNFKKLTCMTKEEQFIVNSRDVAAKHRYCFGFATLQNDMGFGAKTGDLIESMVVYSMDPNQFQVEKKYWVDFRTE